MPCDQSITDNEGVSQQRIAVAGKAAAGDVR
jgi:hypothetical protein